MVDNIRGISTWKANIKCKCHYISYLIYGKLSNDKSFDLFQFWVNKYFTMEYPLSTIKLYIEYTYLDDVLLLCLDNKRNLIEKIENPSQDNLMLAFNKFKKCYKAFSLLR
jgi:hypothetical protein